MIISGSIHVAADGISLFVYGWVIFHGTYTCHIFTHWPVGGHLGCFLVLAIVNSAAVNLGVPVSFQIIVFSGYMPHSGSAES